MRTSSGPLLLLAPLVGAPLRLGRLLGPLVLGLVAASRSLVALAAADGSDGRGRGTEPEPVRKPAQEIYDGFAEMAEPEPATEMWPRPLEGLGEFSMPATALPTSASTSFGEVVESEEPESELWLGLQPGPSGELEYADPYSQTGIMGDPDHEVTYANHPFEKLGDELLKELSMSMATAPMERFDVPGDGSPSHRPSTPAPRRTSRPGPPSLVEVVGEDRDDLLPLEMVEDDDGDLGTCQGDCDRDEDCRGPLLCYQRNDYEAVPGCTGRGERGVDYCALRAPSDALFLKGDDWHPGHNFPLGNCEGDCDSDWNCQRGLICVHVDEGEEVPGCVGASAGGKDYCADPGGAEFHTRSRVGSGGLGLEGWVDFDDPGPGPTEPPTIAPTMFPTWFPTIIPTKGPIAPLTSLTASRTVSFYAVGDVPYSDMESCLIPHELRKLSPDEGTFLVHLGDIQDGKLSECPESMHEGVAKAFEASPVPTFFAIGDNGWMDCGDGAHADDAFRHWETHLLSYHERTDLNWPPLGADVARHPDRPEFASFVLGEVLFVRQGLPWPREDNLPDRRAWRKYMKANVDWMESSYDANKEGIRAMVIFAHATPSEYLLGLTNFASKVPDLPILLVKDGHWFEESTNYAPNLYMIRLDDTVTPASMTVDVDAAESGRWEHAKDVFRYDRRCWCSDTHRPTRLVWPRSGKCEGVCDTNRRCLDENPCRRGQELGRGGECEDV